MALLSSKTGIKTVGPNDGFAQRVKPMFLGWARGDAFKASLCSKPKSLNPADKNLETP